MRGHDGESQPRGALGHGGRQHGADVDALLERAVGDPQREPRVADDQRDDVGVGAGDLEALARELRAQRAALAWSFSTRRGCSRSSSSAAIAAATAGGGGAVEVDSERAWAAR